MPHLAVKFQGLNNNTKRETYHSSRPFDALYNNPSKSFKKVVDVKDGYCQIKLDSESSLLSTFITIKGRCQFLYAPQGLKSSGDA